MGKNMRRVKHGRRAMVYFDENLDKKTNDWLDNCSNRSFEISQIVIKYANGEFIEKDVVEKERKVLLDRIKDLKDMLDRLLPRSNSNSQPEQNTLSSYERIANNYEIASSIDKEEKNHKRPVCPEDDDNPVSKANKDDTDRETESIIEDKNIEEESVENTIPDKEQRQQNEGNKNTGIGNYKNGRGFKKKGKGLADLQ